MKKSNRKTLAHETLKIMEQGEYIIDDKRISIQKELQKCIENTELIRSEIQLEFAPSIDYKTQFIVKNGTTLEACEKLTRQNEPVFCLNFASAKNPGGGFLGGAEAQEESLARSSGLYNSLISKYDMYEENRQHRSCLYLDHMIYSPQTPVFRNDKGDLLEEFYSVSFLTAPAVNAGVVKRNEPSAIEFILPTMKRRIERVLSLALQKGYTQLVLGAWGCGVFQNDPVAIAQLFYEALNGPFKGKFNTIYMAVLDKRERGIFEAFNTYFH